jgi:hypothetical protein
MRYPAALLENIRIVRNLLSGGIFNAAGIGFAVYICAICYPGIKATPAQLMDLRSGFVSQADVGESSLIFGVPVLLTGLFLFARHGVMIAVYRAQPILVFLLIYSAIIIFMSIVSAESLGSPAQIVQYVVTAGCFVLCLCFWQAPAQYIDDALAMGFLALALSLSVAAAVQGFHDFRWVGLIHPNHYARYAYVALVLHSLVVKRVSLLVFIPCFAATYMVSARTIMIGTLLFYFGYLAMTHYTALFSRFRQMVNVRILGIILIGLPVAMGFAMLFLNTDRLVDKITNDLAIFDADRGVLSGFTGRSESWNVFFDSIDKFVFFGYGFRSSRYGLHTVHSGILSYFMDFGLILGSVLLLAILSRAVYLIWHGFHAQEHRSLLCGLAIATTLLIQWFEPDNFNIGFIGAFFFMLILAYVEPVRRLATRERAPVRRPAPRFTTTAATLQPDIRTP